MKDIKHQIKRKDKVTLEEVNKFLDDNKKVMERNTLLLAMYLKKDPDYE